MMEEYIVRALILLVKVFGIFALAGIGELIIVILLSKIANREKNDKVGITAHNKEFGKKVDAESLMFEPGLLEDLDD